MAVVGFDTNACSSGEEANTTSGNRNSLEIIAVATMVNYGEEQLGVQWLLFFMEMLKCYY